ncbi:carbohydrate ABC transporter permease [Paenibacillus roseipurpureus]|uniref:Carbohydrate ABC transporter permease n=1 Tax=Paenibacillus roseopurpureus TaxID=2918901 RepID=A0AA96LWM9_9BACL|nr:carbohydrate ABC transporter permease [Paenibacillus sp. MBLB1832]WNR46030.1 carbohydrate ABC transporter permease [Paenibacillus sp. MBLB1832]
MKKVLDYGLTYMLLIFFAVISLFPFYWMLITSLKDRKRAFVYPPEWIPDQILLSNFSKVWNKIDFATYMSNTLFVTVILVAGQLMFCAMAAYGFSRMTFPGRDFIFVLLLGSMMIPQIVTMIPLYILMKSLGWIDTYKALIIPGMFGNAFGVFMLRQFFLGVPKEFEDAARIDGAGIVRTFVTIILPMAKSALVTLGVLTFVQSWNNFQWPLIIINSPEKQVISVALASLQGQFTADMTGMMAGALITLAPILIIFIVAQKYFVQSIQMSGFK